jgi:hypothetical protein
MEACCSVRGATGDPSGNRKLNPPPFVQIEKRPARARTRDSERKAKGRKGCPLLRFAATERDLNLVLGSHLPAIQPEQAPEQITLI